MMSRCRDITDPVAAQALQVSAGSPIFLIERTSSTTGNRPVDYEKLHYRGDLIRFVTRLARRPKTSMQHSISGMVCVNAVIKMTRLVLEGIESGAAPCGSRTKARGYRRELIERGLPYQGASTQFELFDAGGLLSDRNSAAWRWQEVDFPYRFRG
jgi:UTRA domain